MILVGLALCISARGQVSRGPTNGTDLLHQCAAYDRQITKRGAADAAIEASEIGYGLGYCFGVINATAEILQVHGDIHVPDGEVSFEQLKKIVMNYLNAHPEEWQNPASVVVTKALRNVWGPETAK